MRRIAAALLSLTVLLMAVAALAADIGDLADQAAFRHYAVESGAPVDINGMEQLVAELPDEPAFYFVALADDPPEGADVVADDILARIGSGTVVVVSPTDIGAVSTDFSDAQLGGALDASLPEYDRSYVDGFRVFAETLEQAEPAAPSGGGGSALVPILLIGGLILVTVVLVRRGSKKDERLRQRRLDEARAEIKAQLDAIANRILELGDQIAVADNEEATEHFRAASAVYDQELDAFEKVSALEELEQLSDRLDVARWELEAADALTEGRPVPPKPKPEERSVACFFDPTHGAGTEEATITTPAGAKTVMVCRACAEKLRRGEKPQPRDVVVGGRRMPAPMAPRSYGGGGFDWMDVFEVVVAGMATKARYENRTPRRTRTMGFPTTGRTRTASRSSTRSRSSRGSSASRTRKPRTGRARRRR